MFRLLVPYALWLSNMHASSLYLDGRRSFLSPFGFW